MASLTEQKAQAYIRELAEKHRQFYNTPLGRGAIRDLQQSFPHTWIYVAELIQNAVDAGAKNISFYDQSAGTLVFEHDGKTFEQKDVEGICSKGVSTKGAATVGFMGVGFKATFRSFQTVRISSLPWKFKLQVKITTGKKYGDQQRDWLGSVLPEWDSSVALPSKGNTCRFELSDRIEGLPETKKDFEAVLRAQNALFALLATQEIKTFDLFNKKWDLSCTKEGEHRNVDCTRHKIFMSNSDGAEATWLLFSKEYSPTKDAVRKFLEHRALKPAPADEEKVYGDASRQRKVEIFFPLDKDGAPDLPDSGEAFATLPTSISLPLGVHINADWLLAITREELMDIGSSDNAWQDEIRAQIPGLIGAYLEWLGSTEGPSSVGEDSYKIFPKADEDGGMPDWMAGEEFAGLLKSTLSEIDCLPAFPDEETGTFSLLEPKTARALPEKFYASFTDNKGYKLQTLFGANIIDTNTLGGRATSYLRKTGIISELTGPELSAFWGETKVKEWADALPEDARFSGLYSILKSVESLPAAWGGRDLICIPSEGEKYTSVSAAKNLPPDWNIVLNAPEILAVLTPILGDKRDYVRWTYYLYVYRQGSSWSNLWSSLGVPQATLEQIVDAWWAKMPSDNLPDTDIEAAVAFTCWVQDKQPGRRALVKKLIGKDSAGKLALLPCSQTLLAEPYAGSHRRLLFPEAPIVADNYFRSLPKDPADWKLFFEGSASTKDLSPLGKAPLEPNVDVLDRQRARTLLGFEPPDRRARYTSTSWQKYPEISVDNSGYHIVDFRLPQKIKSILQSSIDKKASDILAAWLTDNISALRETSKKRMLYIAFGNSVITEKPIEGQCSWASELKGKPWIMAQDGSGPYIPGDLLSAPDESRPEAHVAALEPALIEALKAVGITFGVSVPRAKNIRALKINGPAMGIADLRSLLNDCIEEANNDSSIAAELKEILLSAPIFPIPADEQLFAAPRQVPGSRCAKSLGAGPTRRSSLGWVVGIDSFPAESDAAALFTLAESVISFPSRLTAYQAIDFLEWVWGTKPEADSVRKFLPLAYEYVGQEISIDAGVKAKWESAKGHGAVYTLARQWAIPTTEAPVYFDDIGRDIPGIPIPKAQIATAGHLGDKREGAMLLGLPLLSSRYAVETERGTATNLPHGWKENYAQIQKMLLSHFAIADGDKKDSPTHISLRRLASLHRKVTDTATGQVISRVEIGAEIDGDSDLFIAGDPKDFAADLSVATLARLNIRDTDTLALAPDLTALLVSIGDEDFDVRLSKKCAKHGISVPAAPTADKNADGASDSNDAPGDNDGGSSGASDAGGASGSAEPGNSSEPRNKPRSRSPGSGHGGGGHTEDDRERKLKGQIRQLTGMAPKPEDSGDDGGSEDGEGQRPNDIPFRAAVMRYEAQNGRYPIEKPEDQEGHDIDSFSAPVGSADRRLKRRIEVKGRTHEWIEKETVELSRAQFDAASTKSVEDGTAVTEDFDYWLYVVEIIGDNPAKVIPIKNPAKLCAKFDVRAGTWRHFEEKADGQQPAPQASAPTSGRRSLDDLRGQLQPDSEQEQQR